jgi:peroxiredoxin
MGPFSGILAVIAFGMATGAAQQKPADAAPASKSPELALPSNPKAQKAFQEAIGYANQRNPLAAIESYKKAVKLDPACLRCAKNGIDLALTHGQNKDAWEMAELVEAASTSKSVTDYAQYEGGVALYREGAAHNKKDLLERANAKFESALAAAPNDYEVMFADGMVLANLKEDDKAKSRFEAYVKAAPETNPNRSRAERYIERPELARERMAPNFRVTTMDGQPVSMDDLQGKVVLLDFWATWCGPCNAELPHVKEIVAKYSGRPLVVLSVSWDKDETKWKEFVASHGMTWSQYRDEDHHLTQLFGIDAIPHYFTIDTDGVLKSEQLGSGSDIDGKLKKMVAEAEKKRANAAKGGD